MKYGSPDIPHSEVYHTQAVQCRLMAELCRREKRDHLFRVAADYDMMAAQAEAFEHEVYALRRQFGDVETAGCAVIVKR